MAARDGARGRRRPGRCCRSCPGADARRRGSRALARRPRRARPRRAPAARAGALAGRPPAPRRSGRGGALRGDLPRRGAGRAGGRARRGAPRPRALRAAAPDVRRATPRGARNRELAAALAEAGDLWLRLGRSEPEGEALLAAARHVDATSLDLAALAREGNLGIVDWLSPVARAPADRGDARGGARVGGAGGAARRVAGAARRVDRNEPDADLGLYVHVPFCRTRCRYCDFYRVGENRGRMDRFVAALEREIDGWTALHGRRVETVFFGGGTPSLLEPEEIGAILDRLGRRFAVARERRGQRRGEPLRPRRPRSSAGLRAAGVNRLSIGVQSFVDRELRLLGRRHDAARAARGGRARRARAGFERLSLDLMVGIPGQTDGSFAASLARAIELAPDHLSLYLLEVHEGSEIDFLRRERPRLFPGEEPQRRRYLAMRERLTAAGFRPLRDLELRAPRRASAATTCATGAASTGSASVRRRTPASTAAASPTRATSKPGSPTRWRSRSCRRIRPPSGSSSACGSPRESTTRRSPRPASPAPRPAAASHAPGRVHRGAGGAAAAASRGVPAVEPGARRAAALTREEATAMPDSDRSALRHGDPPVARDAAGDGRGRGRRRRLRRGPDGARARGGGAPRRSARRRRCSCPPGSWATRSRLRLLAPRGSELLCDHARARR